MRLTVWLGDLKVRLFGKSPWHTLIPTGHCNDSGTGKEKGVEAIVSWTRGLDEVVCPSKA